MFCPPPLNYSFLVSHERIKRGRRRGGGVENQVLFVLPERFKILHNFAVALLSLFGVRDTPNLHESRRLKDVTNISC